MLKGYISEDTYSNWYL